MLAVAEFIVAPDIEVAAIAELNAHLPFFGGPSTVVSTSVISPLPDRFIRVLVTGGTQRDMVTDAPTITVECWTKREGDSERLAAWSRAILEAAGRNGLMGGVVCYAVATLSRPQNLPHPTITDRFRYTFTVSADLRMI